jgi:ADP-heptose:LPS heptosyltransferase
MISTVPEEQTKRGYVLRREPWNTLLWSFDHALSILRAPRSTPVIPRPPKRILVANIAHLGDVVNATAVVTALRDAFPEAEIGFLTSSWARAIVESNPAINHIHTFDHFLLNRSRLSKRAKFNQQMSSLRQALLEMRRLQYEIAIETYHFIQNSIPLLWLAKPWISQNKPLVEYHLALLEFLGLAQPVPPTAHPTVVVPQVDTPDLPEQYLVLHPGTGAAFKEWQVEKWCELAAKLLQTGCNIILTGAGVHEAEISARIKRVVPSAIDLSGRLTFAQFMRIIQKARLLVGVDSLAGHLAAASATPSVLIYTGANNQSQMRPFGGPSEVVTWEVPCSPCFRTNGCTGMECIRNVTVARVFQQCLESLQRQGTVS